MKRYTVGAASGLAAMAFLTLVVVLAFRADALEQGYITKKPQMTQQVEQNTAMCIKTTAFDTRAGQAGEIPLSDYLTEVLFSSCERNEVPVALALAVCEAESGFQVNAINGDCFGLMQLDLRYAHYYIEHTGLQNVTEPANNLAAGIWRLGELLAKYEDTELALMVYNLGETKALSWWEQGVRSTRYTHRVLAMADQWEQAGKEDAKW